MLLKDLLHKIYTTICVGGFILSVTALFLPETLYAEVSKIEELKSKIDTHSKTIEALAKEITKYQQEVKETGKQASTLKNTITILDTTHKKLTTDLSLTTNKIGRVELTIEKLGLEIQDKETKRTTQEMGLRELIREMREADTYNALEAMLAFSKLSILWGENDRRAELSTTITSRIRELTAIKTDLANKKQLVVSEHTELNNLKNELRDKSKAVEYNKLQKTTLLTETQNKETGYKKILAEKVKQKEEFEKELFEAASQLKVEIDKSKLPTEGRGVLSWPVDKPSITQYYGATKDAKRLYVSGTHNGIDLRAPNGTAIKSALAGVVSGTGNTDLTRGCYSYGKWVLVRHDNGLSTLYAHLSVTSVAVGQPVSTGEIIGYSGATGYATGPHLHFTVYASQGVTVQKFAQGKFCKNVSMPVASKDAYLDPIDYLSKL